MQRRQGSRAASSTNLAYAWDRGEAARTLSANIHFRCTTRASAMPVASRCDAAQRRPGRVAVTAPPRRPGLRANRLRPALRAGARRDPVLQEDRRRQVRRRSTAATSSAGRHAVDRRDPRRRRHDDPSHRRRRRADEVQPRQRLGRDGSYDCVDKSDHGMFLRRPGKRRASPARRSHREERARARTGFSSAARSRTPATA